MNKLTALIEAAKAATPGPWQCHWKLEWSVRNVELNPYVYVYGGRGGKNATEVDSTYIALANPATILELCVLLEKAEVALKAQVEDRRDGPFFHEDEHLKGSCLRNSEEALTAIKQWKEQT